MPELPEVETVRRTLKNFVLKKLFQSMYYILILLKMMLRNLLKPVQIRLLMILIGLENF